LENDLAIFLVPIKDTSLVYAGYTTYAGGRNEDDEKTGIAHFLEHLLFCSGTQSRPGIKFTNQLKEQGIEYNAMTTYEYTSYYFRSETSNIKKLLDLLLDMYINPKITQNEIDRELGVILEEMTLRNNYSIYKFLSERFAENTTLARPLIGTRETLSTITKKDVDLFHKTYYQPCYTTFVICGNFNKDQVLKLIQSPLSKLKNNPDLSPQMYGHEQDIIFKNIRKQERPFVKLKFAMTQNVDCLMMFPLFKHFDESYKVVDVISNLIRNRLEAEIRVKRSITYSPHCFIVGESIPFIVLNVSVNVLYVIETLKVCIEILRELKTKGITDAEFKSIIKYSKNKYIGGFTDIATFFEAFSTMHIYDPDGTLDMKADLKEYDKIKKNDIKHLAQKIFISKYMNVLLYGNLPANTANYDFLLEL
jgi:predicted Zn-dependent peptidase